jgi:hypothetical protein
MKRLASGVITSAIGFGGLLTACGDDESTDTNSDSVEAYCARLDDYLVAMGEGMRADADDPRRWDAWAAEAEETAAVAPSELREHWDFIVDYSARLSEAGGALDAMEPGDVENNGNAGNAIVQDAQERCE